MSKTSFTYKSKNPSPRKLCQNICGSVPENTTSNTPARPSTLLQIPSIHSTHVFVKIGWSSYEPNLGSMRRVLCLNTNTIHDLHADTECYPLTATITVERSNDL